jgi:HSP20 family protein
MRSRIQAVVLPSEPTEFRDEVRRIFQELGRSSGAETLTGECAPALDVFETDESVDITMDLPGVPAAAVRIIARGQTVLIAGHKAPRRTRPESSFHLVERGYGRFARAVRLTSPCDTSRASATLVNGELRIAIPRLAERRGRTVRIAIAGETPSA